MKLRAIAALAVTLALAFSSPAKAENVDADFVALATISYAVLQKCSSSYEFIDGGARRAADRMGADFETYAPATMNAIFVIMDMEYDRTKLIPSVTQRVRSHLEELLVEIKKGDRVFCKKYGAVMVNIGFMRKIN
ncbi:MULTISPECIES: hypothetical protein [Bradyrhizobium]|uniref:Uncharacterized protein n=1 Tax=Bradyrhizobium elkanii TaxID=29448 RepID=A0A8I1YBT4_BRAEL|nr:MULTISPECIES: hypothetical protein [Bradyrhizobium]MBP1297043.1 hypothetical protein [Bradyrhizobium elkanii]QOZ17939.1 hypothetical protein XI02_25095 [Bradyrhizobium sp. CCBAU 21365]